jgi:hypothetical protein
MVLAGRPVPRFQAEATLAGFALTGLIGRGLIFLHQSVERFFPGNQG